MHLKSTCLILAACLILGACETPEDPADEEFYFAEARGEQNLALSYLKRAQYARNKQVEFLKLAETQEELLRELRGEVTKQRGVNNKLAQQVQTLKAEAATLTKEASALATAKKANGDKIKGLSGEIAANKKSIAELEAEIKVLKKKKADLAKEQEELRQAFGPEKDQDK